MESYRVNSIISGRGRLVIIQYFWTKSSRLKYSNISIEKKVKNRVWCWYFEGSLGLQIIDVEDLKFTACQLMYTFMKAGV